jgi:Synergist-CTERM protein sorting domain-containing protein
MRKFLALVLALCLVFPGAIVASAANFEWIAGGSDGAWRIPTNWRTGSSDVVGPIPERGADNVRIDRIHPYHTLLNETRVIGSLSLGGAMTDGVRSVGRLDIGTLGKLTTMDDVIIGAQGTGTVNVQGEWIIRGSSVSFDGVNEILVADAGLAFAQVAGAGPFLLNTRSAHWTLDPDDFPKTNADIAWTIAAAAPVTEANGVLSVDEFLAAAPAGPVEITAKIADGIVFNGENKEFEQKFTVTIVVGNVITDGGANDGQFPVTNVTIASGAVVPPEGIDAVEGPGNLAIGTTGTGIGELNINGGTVKMGTLTLGGDHAGGNNYNPSPKAEVRVTDGSLETSGVTNTGPYSYPAITLTGSEWDAGNAISLRSTYLEVGANSVLSMKNTGAIGTRTINLSGGRMRVVGSVAGESITNTVAIDMNGSAILDIGSLAAKVQVGIPSLTGTLGSTLNFSHEGAWTYPAGAEQVFTGPGSIVNLNPQIGLGVSAGEMTLTSLGNEQSAVRNLTASGTGTLVLGVNAVPEIPSTAQSDTNGRATDALIRLQGGTLKWAQGNTFDASFRLNRGLNSNRWMSWGTIDVGSNDVVLSQLLSVEPDQTLTIRSSDTAAGSGSVSTSARGEGSLTLLNQILPNVPAPLAMYGRWIVAEGTLVLGGSIRLDGDLVVLAGATLEIAQGVTFTNRGMITVDGMVKNAGNIVNNGVITAIDPSALGTVTGNEVIPQDGRGDGTVDGNRPDGGTGGPGTPGTPGEPGPAGPRGSSGSGCNAGFGLAALFGAALLVFRRK